MIVEVHRLEPLARPPDATVRVPGSKSITNRALLLAALAEGETVVRGALFSDDTAYMAAALRQLGVPVREDAAGAAFAVQGCSGRFPATEATLFVGNAGTAARFLVAAACLGHGRFVVDGNARMRERPIGDLLAALGALGADVSSPTGCPPVTIAARGLPGGRAQVASHRSSQFLSALLMVAPYAAQDVCLEIGGALIAKPYVDLTVGVMAQFGVRVDRDGYAWFRVGHGQRYRGPGTYAVEADASSAHYFLAAAALTGGVVRVEGVGRDSLQGDARFVDVLEAMGATVEREGRALVVRGAAPLRGVDVDLNALSDTAPTLAVVAAFAAGRTRIRGVAHIRHQESERVASVTAELRKLGAGVQECDDGWVIEPAALRGAEIETYDDHRLAMAFALAGLRLSGVAIRNPGCVRKTFPEFFACLEGLRR